MLGSDLTSTLTVAPSIFRFGVVFGVVVELELEEVSPLPDPVRDGLLRFMTGATGVIEGEVEVVGGDLLMEPVNGPLE